MQQSHAAYWPRNLVRHMQRPVAPNRQTQNLYIPIIRATATLTVIAYSGRDYLQVVQL